MPTPNEVEVNKTTDFDTWVSQVSAEAGQELWKRDRATGHWLGAIWRGGHVWFCTETPRGSRRTINKPQARLLFSQIEESNHQIRLYGRAPK